MTREEITAPNGVASPAMEAMELDRYENGNSHHENGNEGEGEGENGNGNRNESDSESGSESGSEMDYDDNWEQTAKVWTETEAESRKQQDEVLRREYAEETSKVRGQLVAEITRHSQLTAQLLQTCTKIDKHYADLAWLDDTFQELQDKLAEDRQAADQNLEGWVNRHRARQQEVENGGANANGVQSQDMEDVEAAVPSANGVTNGHVNNSTEKEVTTTASATTTVTTTTPNGNASTPKKNTRTQARRSLPDSPTGPVPSAATASASAASPAPTATAQSSRLAAEVEVVNAKGETVGSVVAAYGMNHWIDKLSRLPLLRSVETRPGRHLTQSSLDATYHGTDPKKSKLLSILVQATGEVQTRPCLTCSRSQGPYSQCIIVGGHEFPRCGNCEWNKQGCHGASVTGAADHSPQQQQSQSQSQSQKQNENQSPKPNSKTNYQESPANYTYSKKRFPYAVPPPLSEPRATLPNGVTLGGDKDRRRAAAERIKKPEQRQQQQQNQKQQQQQSAEEPRRGSRAKDRQSSGNANASANGPAQGSPRDKTPDLEEITAKSLVLKDDGMIFLEPEIMRGVPLRKISPDDAYWEPEWKAVEAAIQSKLDEWTAKLNALRQIPDSSLTEKDRTAIFQAGRQVNRGTTTLRFLPKSDFHPFQVIGKKWITPTLAHYDTLYRLVATLEELAKFRIDMTPLQWLRHRLYEIYSVSPADFKLDRVVSKLYHDPKLADLRSKNGFGNIGRPSRPRNSTAGGGGSGSGSATTNGEGSASKPKPSDKRKELPAGSTTPTPKRRSGANVKHVKSRQRLSQAQQAQARGADEPPQTPTPQAKTREQQGQTGSGALTLEADVPKDANAPKDTNASKGTPASKDADTSMNTVPKDAPGATDATTNTPDSKSQSISGFAVSPDAASTMQGDDLDFDGYTSTDSLTKDPVVRCDWRVYQVKTMRVTSNPGTTQYWHWVDAKDFGRGEVADPFFEHQVLRDTEPRTSWGVFCDDIDFHLRLRELTNIAYARDSQKIVIGTRQVEGVEWRGNVLAHFKRDRTKRRFLAFMRQKGVDVVRSHGDAIEEEWQRMQSEVMPGNESE